MYLNREGDCDVLVGERGDGFGVYKGFWFEQKCVEEAAFFAKV